jgi:hypothetical protein
MENAKRTSIPDINAREERFLDRLSSKYEKGDNAGQVRSYAIASVVILMMFALSRWLPWWGLAIAVVEAVGLMMFRQYKRFASFKSRLLSSLWRYAREVSERNE